MLLALPGVIAILLHAQTVTPTELTAAAPPMEQYWQMGSNCGPNALYCMLRIHGKPVEYLELLRYLSPPQEGNSLHELRNASALWGLSSCVYRVEKRDISRLDTPFIAHLENHGSLHFVLVLGQSRGQVKLWDVEQGIETWISEDKFFRMWTGYALATKTMQIGQIVGWLILFELCVLVLLIRHRKSAVSHPAPTAISHES